MMQKIALIVKGHGEVQALPVLLRRMLPQDMEPPADPDAERNPKAWLAQRMPNGYRETLDQAAFSQTLDLVGAKKSRSFLKLMKEVARFLRQKEQP